MTPSGLIELMWVFVKEEAAVPSIIGALAVLALLVWYITAFFWRRT